MASTQNWSFEFITEKNLKTREYGAKLKRIKKKITRLTERETFRELARHCQEHGLRLPNASCTEFVLSVETILAAFKLHLKTVLRIFFSVLFDQ